MTMVEAQAQPSGVKQVLADWDLGLPAGWNERKHPATTPPWPTHEDAPDLVSPEGQWKETAPGAWVLVVDVDADGKKTIERVLAS